MLRQRRRGEQVRRVLRPGSGEPAAGRPRDDRQHVARVRRDVRDLPGRRRDAALPALHRPAAPSRSSWSRRTAAPRGCSTSRARPSRRSPTRSSSTWRPSSRAWPGRAGRRTASRSRDAASDFREELRTFVSGEAYKGWDTSAALTFPASDPPSSKAEGVSPKPMPAHRGDGEPVPRTQRDRDALDHGAVVIAAITSCTNTSNPSVMLGAGLLAKKAVEAGLTRRPWVKTSLAPGLEGRHGVPRARGADRAARAARLLARRLRLHDLHRQLGPAAGGDLARDRRARPDRVLGAVGQPQLRGAHPPRGQDELPRQPAACAWPTRWPGGWTSTSRASRCRATCAWPTSGRRSARWPTRSSRRSSRTCSAAATARCSPATRTGTALDVPAGERYAWDPASTYVRRPPYFEGMAPEPAEGFGTDHGRARDRAARRQRHHRPHLAGRGDRARLARRALPARARRRAPRLQLLRLAARQPRGDDARHVRQRPPAQPARAGHRGRR